MQFKKIIFFALGPLGSAAISFAMLPMMTWIFSVEDIGRFAILQVAISLSFVFYGLALDQIYVREYFEYPDKIVLLKTLILPGILLFLLSACVLLIFKLNIVEILFNIHNEINNWFIFLTFFFWFVIGFVSLNLRMSGRAESYSIITIIPKLALLLCIAANYFLFHFREFKYIIYFNLIAFSIGFLVSIFYIRNIISDFFILRVDRVFLKLSIRASLPLIVATWSYWGITTADKLILRYFSSFEELGIYSVAMSFAGVAVLVQGIFSTIWSPIFYKWSAEGLDEKKLLSVVEKLLAFFVIFYSLIGIFSWMAIYIVPNKYYMVQYILPSCIGGSLLYMLSETTVVGIYLKRKYQFSMIAAMLSFFVSLLFNVLLIPRFGASGAAVATSFGFLSFLILRTEFSSRFLEVFPKKKIYSSSILCVALSAVQSIFYENMGLISIFIWVVVLSVSIFYFRKSVFFFLEKVSERFKFN